MPKRNSKKRSYYNPDAAIGYEMLRHAPQILEMGTAQQAHDQRIATKIDLEAQRQRAQDAEEREWEETKRRDRESLLEKLAQYPMPTAMGTMNQLGAMTENVGAAYNHIKNRDLPDMPEDYGMSDFLSDQWNSFFDEMNHLQAENARGYQTRALADKDLINKYQKSLDILDEVDTINYRLSEINNILANDTNNSLTQKQVDTATREANQLYQRRQELERQYEQLGPDRKKLEDITNQTAIGKTFDDLVAGQGFLGGILDSVTGKTTAIHDELNDARRYLSNLSVSRTDRMRNRRNLNLALKELDNLNKGWNAVIRENETESQERKKKISSWFKSRAERAGTDFTDPDTYLFKMPGIMGGSASSWMKQYPAMLGQLAVAIGTGGASLPVQIAAGAGAAGLSFALQRGAGIDENNAEVAMNAMERIKDRTGLSEQEINDIISGKSTDQAKLRKIAENVKDVENLFNTDMAATTWDAAFDTALMAMPIGAMAKAKSFLKGRKALRFVAEHPTLKQIYRSKFFDDFASGAAKGSVLGIPGAAVSGAANATVGRLAKAGARLVVDKTDDTAIGALGKRLWKRLENIGKASMKLDENAVETAAALNRATNRRYFKGITGGLVKSSVAEGIEEGKQYLAGQAFQRGDLDGRYMDTIDVGVTDLLNGLTSGAYILGIPLDGLGLINIRDKGLLQDIKGGMLGGLQHTGSMYVLKNTLPYIAERKANDLVAETLFTKKLASLSDLKQYTNWLSRGLLTNKYRVHDGIVSGDMVDAFARLRQMNEDHKAKDGSYAIDPSMIDDAFERYTHLIGVATDPITKLQAKAAGIQMRTATNPKSWKSNKQYHEFVAAKVVAEDRLNEILENKQEADSNLRSVQQEVSINNATKPLQQLNFGEEITIAENHPESVRSYDDDRLQIKENVAYLAALLKYRNSIETALEAQAGNPNAKVRRGLREQLNRLNKSIKEAKQEVSKYSLIDADINTLEDLEDHLVYDQQDHDRLRDAYEEKIKWDYEYESAQLAYENLVGKIQKIGEDGKARDLTDEDYMTWNPRKDIKHVAFTKGNAIDVLNDIHKMEKDDDDFESRIEEMYQGDLKAQHLREENGWPEPKIRPERYVPVTDPTTDMQKVVNPNDARALESLAEDEFVTTDGRVFRQLDYGRKDPLEETLRAQEINKDGDKQLKDSFKEAFKQISGTELPTTPEQYLTRRAPLGFTASKSSPKSTSNTTKPTQPKAPIAPEPTPEPEKSRQDEVVEMLENKYKETQKIVLDDEKGYHTTSQDYFILIDEKTTRMSRVHNVKPRSYIRPQDDAEINEIYNKLKSAKTVKQLEDLLKTYSDIEATNYQIIPYIKYIKDNETIFLNNPSAETEKEYQDTLKHLSQAIFDSLREKGPSVHMGNIVDELSRNFFGSPVLYAATSTESGIKQLFESKNESDGRTYKELFQNYDQFKDTINQLRSQYEYYVNTLGWKLIALPIKWHSKFVNTGWIAGETDLVGVDQNGDIHIIDFKTSKYTFGHDKAINMQLSQEHQDSLSKLTRNDFFITKNGEEVERISKNAREVLRSIKDDSGTNTITIGWSDSINQAQIYDKIWPFVNTPNERFGQVLSAYQDYSDQQTAYAMMIMQAETGSNVRSIEILGYKCSYDYDASTPRKIYSINLEGRIMLPFSSNMTNILNAVDQSEVQNRANHLKQLISEDYDRLIQARNFVQSKIEGNVFDTLSEDGKFIFSDWATQIDNLKIPETDDINMLENVLYEIDMLLNQYDDVTSAINQDYQKEKAKLAVQQEQQQKTQAVEQHVQETPPGEAVDTVRAKNKKKSYGNMTRTNLNWEQVESDRDLELATISPDFLTSADFEVYLENGKVYVDIKHNGKEYKHIEIDTRYNGDLFANGKRLIEKIEQLEKERKPGQRIVPVRATMNRTAGAIKLAVDKDGRYTYLPVSSTDLFADEDIYDIEFSSSYGNIGFVNNKGDVVTFGKDISNQTVIYQWSDPSYVPNSGTLIYLKRVHKDELNRDSVIPVAIDRTKLTDGDANFILNLIQNPHLLDKEYTADINGTVYNTYATGRQLANILIPIADSIENVGNAKTILRDPSNPNIVRIARREQFVTNGQIETYNLQSQEEINRFLSRIKELSVEESHDVLSARLGQDSNKNNPFSGIKKFFAVNDVKQLKISDSIQFDFDDFATKTSKTGVKRNGLNGFGYYLKHGLLRTQYSGLGSCNVEIADVELENVGGEQIGNSDTTNIPQIPEAQNGEISIDDIDVDDSLIDSFLNKVATQNDVSKKRLPREVAERHIREILGDAVPVKFIEGFIKVAGGPAHVIGNCKADAIEISNLAYSGVEYHEAFHRIFETLVAERERDTIYQKIAKREGINLYNEDGSENKDAFRQCAEYAADRYMDHMNRHMTDIKIPFLTKIFNFIHDWASMFCHIKDRDLYKIFIRVNRGYYKNAMPSKKAIDRFNRLYVNLYARIHDVDFEHIVNRPMYDKIRETALMCIIRGQNVDTSGRNISEIGKNINKTTLKAGIDRLLKDGYDVIGQSSTEELSVGQQAMREYYEKFDNESLRDDMADRLSLISTDYIKQTEQESEENAQGNDVQQSDIGEHTRSSYEFSRFSKTSSRVRFFFATIPDMYYGDPVTVTDKNGQQKLRRPIRLLLNELGLPQFVPVNTMFNEILNALYDVENTGELLERLQLMGQQNPIFRVLHDSLKKKISSMYVVKDGKLTRNADQEALVSQLMNVIRSHKHEFDIARSKKTKGLSGQYTITIQSTDMEYNAKFYPTLWNGMLVNGGTKLLKRNQDGSLSFNPEMKGAKFAFEHIGNTISHNPQIKIAENNAKYSDVGMRQWIANATLANPQQVYLKVKLNGKTFYLDNPRDYGQISIVKQKFVEMLNLLGINIHMEEFNYMLEHKYGSSGLEALSYMFSSTAKEDSMTSFLQFLSDITGKVGVNSKITISGKKVSIENAYEKIAFIRELANWKYQYRHAHDQLTVLATNNNKYYQMSDNNYMTDVVRALNKRSQVFEDIKSDAYNYFTDYSNTDNFGKHPVYGSLVLKRLSEDPNQHVVVRNFVGLKTDQRNDFGRDYFEIIKLEDYVSKMTILENDGIISPTMSDKKNWTYLSGIKLPGLDYSSIIGSDGNVTSMQGILDRFLIQADGVTQLDNMFAPDPEVIDQFIQYAICEYQSVLKADSDIDEMERDGTKDTEVDNYYKNEQGAKFSSLLGVWDYKYETQQDGSQKIVGETFISFNDKNKTRKENIKTAEKYFFNRTREEQEMLIARLLHKRFQKEVDTCQKLGLINLVGTSTNPFENYENAGLNSSAVQSIYKALIDKATAHGRAIDEILQNKCKSYATLLYIYDISNKAIMSIQEFERVFSGNPAFYKWKYDDDSGKLTDRTVDELKRFGGIGSTGNNNFTELKDIPEKYLDAQGNFTGKYVCAQVNNEMIRSPQFDIIKSGMEYGHLLTFAYEKLESDKVRSLDEQMNREIASIRSIREMSQEDKAERILEIQKEYEDRLKEIKSEIHKTIDNSSVDELKAIVGEDIANIALEKAEQAYDSFSKDIDVADGAAYITDVMAEMLLRMNGNYSSQIENAFKVLREEKTSTILEKQQAYASVVTEVIGSYKYSAFGRRKHPKTGVYVSYYNKMALFPLFRCMSTGRMQNVYDKMMQQGVDMLMVDSAVKLGGQYSKPLDWDGFMQSGDESDPRNHIDEKLDNPLKPSFDEFEFGTYEQDFANLRKQLNTDPHEESRRSMGTQMTKVALSNLYPGRTYYSQNGEEVDGETLLQRIMSSINELSDRGAKKIEKRFFKTDDSGKVLESGKTLDEEKFSREIKRLLTTKDPDQNILNAIELVESTDLDGVKRKHMAMPLNAISNSSWLESILISQINSDVIDITTTGDASIQRSVWAMENSALYERGKGNILSDVNLSPTINGGKRLQMVNEEGSMDCVVSVDFIKKMFGGDLPRVPIKDKNRNVVWDLVPELNKDGSVKKDENGKVVYAVKRDKDGNVQLDKNNKPIYKRRIRTREMSIDELRNWLKSRGIIGENAKASIIGYRIPTQAQSSIHALRIVDILPVVNDTIILPAEFTKITGSDFDIDKLYLAAIRYKVNREEGEDGKYHQTVTEEFKEKENDYYSNKLIRDYLTLLLDWKSPTDHESRTFNFLHRSIDNDTQLLKDIVKDLESGQTHEPEDPYGFYSLTTQVDSKNDYLTGKVGIGPFALNNNNHILTILYGVKFKHIDSSIMNALGLERLDKRFDDDNNPILSWISGLINAHVDIAKDPFISRLNVNPFTYNLVNLLIRTGFGKSTFYFTTQPIMKALAEAYTNAGSMYMRQSGGSVYFAQQEAIDNVAAEWFEDSDLKINGVDAKEAIKRIKEGGQKNAEFRKSVNAEIEELMKSSMIDDAKRGSTGMEMKHQLLYYLAYLQFEPYANSLSALVQYSKIDTKKHGKSIAEQFVYKQGYEKIYDTTRDDNLFDPVGIEKMQKDSYIGTKTENAIQTTLDILSAQFIESTPGFRGAVNGILNRIGRTASLSPSLVSKVYQITSAAIKSQFFVDTYVPSISNNPNFIHDLINESVDTADFAVYKQGTEIKLNGKINHPLQSYIGNVVSLQVVMQDGSKKWAARTIVGVNESNNSLIVDTPCVPSYGKAVLTGGRNTIYDRLIQLQIKIATDPNYKKLSDGVGGYNNTLLQMLVPSTFIQYNTGYLYGETPDTYDSMKFVKLFNFVDDGGNTSNYIIDAWDELLNYTDDNKEVQNEVREFARDLVVYGFITSGDRGGFTKIFKYVPDSWRLESGYSEFIKNKLVDLSLGEMSDIDIDDIILNNWFDNDIVRTYSMVDKNKVSNFIQYKPVVGGKQLGYATVLSALKRDGDNFVPSIDPNTAPGFIKVRRRKDYNATNSQRQYTVYKLHGLAKTSNGVVYPVYVKINPKGNRTTDNFLITEYGRSDAVKSPLHGSEYYTPSDRIRSIYTQDNAVNQILNISKKNAVLGEMLSDLARFEGISTISEESSDVNTTSEVQVDKIDNSGMTHRPRYDFGRMYLTENDKKHVTEHVSLVNSSGEKIDIDANKLDDIIKKIDRLYDKLTNVGTSYITIKYRDWKQMLQGADGFEYFITKAIMEDLNDWSGFAYDDLIGEYDKASKTIKIDENFYNIVKVLQDNFSIAKKLSRQLNDPNYYAVAHLLLNYKNVYDAVQALNTDADDFYYSNSYNGELQLQYSYSDNRQQELFDDSDFSDEAMKHCKS